MKGPIGPGTVPAVLRAIYVERKTGMLRFIRGDERRSLRFMSGHVVYGQASVSALHLGEVLIAEGRLDRPTLLKAGEVMRRERTRLGAALVAMGVLDEIGLEEALALHVRAILRSVFSLREGTCTFQEQDPEAFLDDDWPLAVSTGEAVTAAVRAVTSEDDVRFALGDLGRVLLASDDPLVLYQKIDPEPAAALVLSRVDGTRTARDVLGLVALPGPAAETALLALLCTGILQFAEAAPSAAAVSEDPLREAILDLYRGLLTRTDHEVLGVAPGTSEAEIKVAYFRLAKRFHPDVHKEPGLGDLREKLEAVFFRIHHAYRNLSPAHAPRRAPDPPPAASGAAPAPAEGPALEPSTGGALAFEAMLRQGRDHMGEGKTWEAATMFEAVAGRAEGRIRTRARVLLGKALLQYEQRDPQQDKAAETALLEAVKDDPAHVEAFCLLGRLYRHRGMTARASAMLRRALEIDPGHRASQAEMDALLGQAPPSGPARFFRRA